MSAFAHIVVHFQLEKEIAAKEEARRNNRPEVLSGHIGGGQWRFLELKKRFLDSSRSAPKRGPMQEVNLDSELDTLDEPVWDTVVCSIFTAVLIFLFSI